MNTDIFSAGGPAMAVLVGLSVLAWAVAMERAWFWFRQFLVRDRSGLLAALDLIQGRRFKSAAHTLERLKRMALARVLLQGVRHPGLEAAGRLEAGAIREHRAMVNHTGILDTVTAAAPLVGILGTVMGIIRSFHAFGSGGIPPPHRVMGGVSEALLTTGAGLVVALVALTFASLQRGLADRGAAELEQTVSQVEPILAKGSRHEA